jgi:hypothetical protein
MTDDDDPRLAKADRDVFHAAATGEGLIPIETAEDLRLLADAAKRTMTRFEDIFAAMTQEQAAYVRKLRCDDGYSWRAVAQTCSLEWDGDWNSNQLAGMAICERAAQLHHEHYMSPPWN